MLTHSLLVNYRDLDLENNQTKANMSHYYVLLFKFHTLYEFRFSDWLICTTWHWVMTKQLP